MTAPVYRKSYNKIIFKGTLSLAERLNTMWDAVPHPARDAVSGLC